MEKYILSEISSSGGATFYKNPSDQSVASDATSILMSGVGAVLIVATGQMVVHIIDLQLALK